MSFPVCEFMLPLLLLLPVVVAVNTSGFMFLLRRGSFQVVHCVEVSTKYRLPSLVKCSYQPSGNFCELRCEETLVTCGIVRIR